MASNKEIKPTPIWPIWVIGLILMILFSSINMSFYITGFIFLICVIWSINAHNRNKLYFGRDYRKNPKPVKEAKDRFKRNKFNLSRTQRIITNTVTVIGLIVGFFTGGILVALLLGFGLGAITLATCMSINKTHISKVIGFLVLGIVFIVIGVWITYSVLIGAVEKVTEEQMQKCDVYCANSEKVNSDSYTQYSVKFDRETKSFICSCLTKSEDVLDETSFKLK